MCRYTTLINVNCLKSKLKTRRLLYQHILGNYRQETMCLVSQLLHKVTNTSCSFYFKCLMCPHSCWTTHSRVEINGRFWTTSTSGLGHVTAVTVPEPEVVHKRPFISTFKPASPLTNGMISEMLPQFVPLIHPFIHSFIRGGGWPLAVFRRAFSYRQR